MSRFISAAVDKFRSEMVDYYMGSWFNHKKANAVVVLRDGLAGPAQMSIRYIEVQENRIILTFDTAAADGGRAEAAVDAGRVRPPTPAAVPFSAAAVADGAPDALFSILDEDEEPIYESMSRGNLRRRNALHSAYSAETVDSESAGGIEMRALPRHCVSLEERLDDSETRFKTTGV